MTRAVVSLAKMKRMRLAIEAAGLPFRGFVTKLDGSVEALVGEPSLTVEPEAAVDEDDDGGWDAYEQAHGHG